MGLLMTIRTLGRRPAGDDGDEPFAPLDPGDPFAATVADSLDELPDEFVLALLNVPVIVSDGGAEAGAYGLYQGAGLAHPHVDARIVIFRDTLVEQASMQTSPKSYCIVFQLGGALGRVGEDDTAFSKRHAAHDVRAVFDHLGSVERSFASGETLYDYSGILIN